MKLLGRPQIEGLFLVVVGLISGAFLNRYWNIAFNNRSETSLDEFCFENSFNNFHDPHSFVLQRCLQYMNPLSVDDEDRTMLMKAACEGSVEDVKKTLREHSHIRICKPNSRGQTPLIHAVKCENLETTSYLAEKGFFCSSEKDDSGRDAYDYALANQNRDIFDAIRHARTSALNTMSKQVEEDQAYLKKMGRI